MSEIPIRCSADPEDRVFGFRHDSLLLEDGTPRNWALLAKECLQEQARLAAHGPAPRKLVCLYANVEYLTQLHTLLKYARTLLDTGEAEHLAIRLSRHFSCWINKSRTRPPGHQRIGRRAADAARPPSAMIFCRTSTGWVRPTAPLSFRRLRLYK